MQASLTPAQTQQNSDQINLLSEKINNLVSEAEQMGTQGNVEQAQGLMKLCDQLKEEREQLRKQNDNSHWQQVYFDGQSKVFSFVLYPCLQFIFLFSDC